MANQQVQDVLAGLEVARARFTYGLDCVPDDRLDWSPGGAAKTPLQLAGKVAGFLGFFTGVFATRSAPQGRGELPPAPETRDAAKAAVDGAYAALRDAISSLSEEDLQIEVAAPWGQVMSLRQWLAVPGVVAGYFQGQLNYLQLCYGDENPNIPPSWSGKAE